ncbi:hypothetical protein WA1_47725 [Scytonema hofmannii PCC 7110]|uniref:Sigma-70 family RNA polymerase sigma factor n=1 Tax=Scytonema hofmannii PCC 7110 TaxID=128403 RepID=A0A139WY53_9CYAN|nr:hypothetical protein [Scytonema hofmannii]KYC37312.1 hypothetical protein WA1_47725 [Scytonema hofmannii PCC 7110]
MDNGNQKIVRLVQQTCQHPQGSLERQEGLTEIVKLVQRKLWKDNSPFYQDALQRTWLYFCRNICEATTGEKFDPERSTVVTWLNAYLKLELRKFYTQGQKTAQRFVSVQISDKGEEFDPLDTVAAPVDVPSMLEVTREWAETDLTGELGSIHIKNHPEITCQAIILRRLPPETSWKEIAAEFKVPLATLSTFYQRQCLPRLLKFGEEQGYL